MNAGDAVRVRLADGVTMDPRLNQTALRLVGDTVSAHVVPQNFLGIPRHPVTVFGITRQAVGLATGRSNSRFNQAWRSVETQVLSRFDASRKSMLKETAPTAVSVRLVLRGSRTEIESRH